MLLPDLFDDVFDFGEPMRGPRGPKERMECDIYEKDGNYVVEASAFGFNKEDIKVVSRMLGHKSIKVTLDTYYHLFEDEVTKANTVLDRVFAF